MKELKKVFYIYFIHVHIDVHLCHVKLPYYYYVCPTYMKLIFGYTLVCVGVCISYMPATSECCTDKHTKVKDGKTSATVVCANKLNLI